jgi:tetratricopeptide (TPR) repeat protein
VDELLTEITEQDRPETFLGRVVELNTRRYRLVSILGEGMEKIAFALEDLQDGSQDRVLGVYRQRKDAAFLAGKRETYDTLKKLGIATLDPEFHFIGGWLVEFMPRGVATIHLGAIRAHEAMDPAYDKADQAAKLIQAGAHDKAWEILDAALDTHPMHPDLLYLGVLALAGSGDKVAAADLARQWLETGSHAGHLVTMAEHLIAANVPRLARAMCYEGVSVADDKIRVWEYLCGLEIDYFGEPDRAQEARDQLAAAGADAERLAEIDTRVKRLRHVIGLLDRCEALGQEDSHDMAMAAIKQWPYLLRVNHQLGFAKFRRHEWAACIGPLSIASAYEPRDPDTVFALGRAHLGVGEPEEARTWWKYWTVLMTKAAERIIEQCVPGRSGEIELDGPAELYLMARRLFAFGLITPIREDMPELGPDLDHLHELLSRLPEVRPE